MSSSVADWFHLFSLIGFLFVCYLAVKAGVAIFVAINDAYAKALAGLELSKQHEELLATAEELQQRNEVLEAKLKNAGVYR